MKKTSKLQKKWVNYFMHPRHNEAGGIFLLVFLFQLKVLDRTTFIECKDAVIDNVDRWKNIEQYRKWDRIEQDKARTYDSKAPKSIKPTRARS